MVSDDGVGMSMKDFCEQFMSLGGSSKFGDGSGSAASGSGRWRCCSTPRPRRSRRSARAARPSRVRASSTHGPSTARTAARGSTRWLPAPPRSSSTTARLTITSRGSLLRTSTRTSGRSGRTRRLSTACSKTCGASCRCLGATDGWPMRSRTSHRTWSRRLRRAHRAWSPPVYVHSAWERDVELAAASFGDDGAGVEDWNGPPVPILKKLRVPGDGRAARSDRRVPAEPETRAGRVDGPHGARSERRRRGAHVLRRDR